MFKNMILKIAPRLPYSPWGLTEIFQKVQFCKKKKKKAPTENVMWKFYIKRITIMLSNTHCMLDTSLDTS